MRNHSVGLSFFNSSERILNQLKDIHPLIPWVIAALLLTPLPWLVANSYQVFLANTICIMILLSRLEYS